ncbi:hypothetical protein E4T44_08077 [Aureobasidium sp. EXF-8845]|nr:hypothetical protein E4T45_10055 [Aureobasidium sp. EXF-8846]KAI4839171.1 hypothetical protein E4T44_08077 [Aureobasidium sp. EXF-8845]
MALVDLPPELLLRVSAFLTTSELGNFRLTSKPIESALFDKFAREFFTKKQFMLEQPSLQALVDISNHPTLASSLSEVVISTHVLPSDPELVSPTSKAMYAAGHANHHVLMASGQALHMLSDAFSKLPNLRTVGLRDYNGRGRYREGNSATWKSWGWSFGWDGLSAYNPNERHSQRPLETISPEHVLPLLFYALGHAKVLPESIHVFLRKREKLTQQSFNILDGYLGDKTRPVLGNMRELMLAIGNETPNYIEWVTKAATPETTNSPPLARLLEHTPRLETLRLNFEHAQRTAHGFLSWLGSPVSDPSISSTSLLVAPISLPRLTALELGMVTVTADILLKILTKFDLESFSLWKVKLLARLPSEPVDCWHALLQDLAAALRQKTCLRSVLIGYPSQLHYGRDPNDRDDDCFFNRVGAPDNLSGWVQEEKHHAGPGTLMADWLEELSARTRLPIPIGPDDSDVWSSGEEGLGIEGETDGDSDSDSDGDSEGSSEDD